MIKPHFLNCFGYNSVGKGLERRKAKIKETGRE